MGAFYRVCTLTAPFFYFIMANMNYIARKTDGTKKSLRGGMIAIVILLLSLICLFVFACGNASKPTTSAPSETKPEPKKTTNVADVVDDFKTEYFVGEALDPTGSLKIYFDVDYYDIIPITAEMISGFDTSSAGEVIVTVTYQEYVATIPIHVYPVTVRTVTAEKALPEVLYKGMKFPSDVTLRAELSDGTTREGIPVTEDMLGGFDPTREGLQTVTITYLGASITFSVTIEPDARKEIFLLDETERAYKVKDPFAAGERVGIRYKSGKESSIALTADLLSGFSTELGGHFEATISYKYSDSDPPLTCKYPYFVQKSPDSFALSEENPLPTVFEKGDDFPTGGKGILTYDDGTTETVSLNSENFPDFSTATAGEKRVEVVVSGVTGIYSYTVLPGVYRVAISGFTENVRQNSEFDGLGEMVVVYEDEGFLPETLPFFGEDATRTVVSGVNGNVQVVSTGRLRIEYRTSVAGDIVQKVYFRNFVGEFTVHVYDETERATAVNGITIAGAFSPIRLGDAIDVTGVQVGIDYKYLDYAVVDCVAAWVSAVLPESLEGDYADVPVLVSYLGAEAQSSVRVLSAEYAAKVTALNVIGVPVLYSIGDEISLDSASAYVEYGGGYASNTVAARDLEVSGFDTSAAGEKTLTLTYGDGVYELTYRVLDEADKVLVTDVSVAGFTPLLFVGDTVESIPRTYELTLILGYGYRSETLSLADESVALSGGPFAEGGMQEVLLTCRGFEKTLRVMVYPASDKTLVTAIAVNDDVTASVGMLPDLSQVRLVVEYGHGYRRELLPLETTGVTIDREPFKGAQVGLVRATVTYEGCTCGLFVNFVSGDGGNVLQRLETSADSKDSFTIGEELNGVELILHYKSGTERLAVTAEMVPDFDTETAGEHTVTISYGGKGVLFTYTVA